MKLLFVKIMDMNDETKKNMGVKILTRKTYTFPRS